MSGSADAILLVAVGEGVDREVHLHARLRAHALDDAADARRELAGVEAAGGAGDVAHQARRELDLVQDAQHGEHRRAGRTPWAAAARSSWYTVVLDLHARCSSISTVGVVDLVDQREVGVEERLGGGADLLARS